MNITTVYTVGAILTLTVGAGTALYYYKKRNLDNFFIQAREMAKQVPKKKKKSFLLLVFKESLLSSKNKKAKNSLTHKLSNPKYLNIQLLQMSNILKDPSKVKDKTTKRALTLLKNYQTWETAKLAKDKQAIEDQAS
ncbi:MAG: hypothetical protein N4A62_13450 [Marinisporobacter sp.]|jgi:hypothetical protein|nr:hypothetical protein [Marinisporobacter sp.]